MKQAILIALAITGMSPVLAQSGADNGHAAAEARAEQNQKKNAGLLDAQARARRNDYDHSHATELHAAAEQRADENREKNASLLNAQARARRNDHNRAEGKDRPPTAH